MSVKGVRIGESAIKFADFRDAGLVLLSHLAESVGRI